MPDLYPFVQNYDYSLLMRIFSAHHGVYYKKYFYRITGMTDPARWHLTWSDNKIPGSETVICLLSLLASIRDLKDTWGLLLSFFNPR